MNTVKSPFRAYSSTSNRLLTNSQPNASGIMTTIPVVILPEGGLATYVGRPWRVNTLPVGSESFLSEPLNQSGQDILLTDVDQGRGRWYFR